MTGAMPAYRFDHALLNSGWARDVRVDVADGAIARVTPNAPRDDAQPIAGFAIPGMPNLHCHAFQRGMAGLAEKRGPAHDSFWTWREVMYRFLGKLTPDDAEAIAAFAYMQMLETGFTAVGEFHYLHHDVDGRPYADVGEMAARIAAAAKATGIGLTLLPALYIHGGFGGAAPNDGQKRFLNDPDRYAALVARSREIVTVLPDARVGIAPHSLRAVTPEALRNAVAAHGGGPIHIHAAEQTKEVADCIAALKATPVAWLLDNANVDRRWCLIHATHMTEDETRRLAASGAVAGLCPLTEASLGDGIFNGAEFFAQRGAFGVGTDSNIQIGAAAELRMLEYSQRLRRHTRNVFAQEGESTGARLYTEACRGGAQALGREIGAIQVGKRADIVVLSNEHADVTAAESVLDAYVFVAGEALVKSVMVGGEMVVADGQHKHRDAITARYRRTMQRLSA
ncbi:MAG TPA: formimidoylglutamate deiminase [Xanthobacteraceae bacterium]|nr:formimidoylglutamate deiminase [Xanthobacteraceae bacterium]